MDVAQVQINNAAEANKFKDFFNLMPKTILIYSAANTLNKVMLPAASKADPDKMAHDSSNAAFNWRFSYSTPRGPLELWDRGHEAVGFKFEKRGASSAAYQAVNINYGNQVDKIYQKFFGAGIDKPVSKLILYNSIDQLNNPKYVHFSNVRGAHLKGFTYASEGLLLGEGILKGFTSSGTGRSPNTKGLEAVVAQRFGNL